MGSQQWFRMARKSPKLTGNPWRPPKEAEGTLLPSRDEGLSVLCRSEGEASTRSTDAPTPPNASRFVGIDSVT